MPIAAYAEKTSSSIAGELGKPEYSYYFVLKAFLPVLRRMDRVFELRDVPEGHRLMDEARKVGLNLLFLCFAPPHRVPEPLRPSSVPVFAWEFEDIPSEVWDDCPQNDWTSRLRETRGAITHSGFAARAVRRALGAEFPVEAIPAPVGGALGSRPASSRHEYAFTLTVDGNVVDSLSTHTGEAEQALTAELRTTLQIDIPGAETPAAREPVHEAPQITELSLTGVVYTTILNPADARKNWGDIVNSFCLAFHDNPDATLLVKFVHANTRFGVDQFRTLLRRWHGAKCRVVLINGFIPDPAYRRLALATHYGVNASSGEGQCLPLMEHMSAGIPAVAPDHTGMMDYVNRDNAFVVESDRAPCGWPQDSRGPYRTFCRRLNKESLVQQFRASYDLAANDPPSYAQMAGRARSDLLVYCSPAAVFHKLQRFVGVHGERMFFAP